MPIYTRTGDNGTTGLIGGKRQSKSLVVFEVLGTLDELNAHLGFASHSKNKIISKTILQVQNDLFELGASIADKKSLKRKSAVISSQVKEFENIIDKLDKELPPLKNFILPGGSETASHLHLARTVCRRLERLMVRNSVSYKSSGILSYVNRLSDLLFALARYANFKSKVKDSIWIKSE